MSTYSQYGTGSFDEGAELVANESYFGVVGCYGAIEECAINEHTIFESIIGRDFAEVYAEMGVIDESSIESLNESAIGDVFGKIAAFFKKIGEKILGILKSFKDRIVSTFIRDGKELVKKYDKQITKKINTNKMTKFSFKWYKGSDPDYITTDEITSSFNKSKLGTTLKKSEDNMENFLKKINDASTIKVELIKEDDIKELKDNCMSSIAPSLNSDFKSFKSDMISDFKDYLEDKEGLDTSTYNEIKEVLKEFKSSTKKLTDSEKNVKKVFGDIVKKAEKNQKTASDALAKTGADKTLATDLNTECSNTIKLGNAISACVTNYYSSVMTIYKMKMKNARSVFVRAATYGGKDEATLMEAVSEVSDYEVDEMFA